MAISYLSLDGFIDCCFFFFPLRYIFFQLHFIRGYWRHVGLTWPIRFIISCPETIMVIDTVTSSPSSSVITAYRSEIQEAAIRGVWGHRRSEHYHGRLMGVNCKGAARVRLRVSNVAHSTLCHVDDRGWPAGPWLSVNPTLDKQPFRQCDHWRQGHPAHPSYTQRQERKGEAETNLEPVKLI